MPKPMPEGPRSFEQDLTDCLQKHWASLRTNTPAYILTEVALDALRSFERNMIRRSNYFRQPTGIEDYPHVDQGSSHPG